MNVDLTKIINLGGLDKVGLLLKKYRKFTKEENKRV